MDSLASSPVSSRRNSLVAQPLVPDNEAKKSASALKYIMRVFVLIGLVSLTIGILQEYKVIHIDGLGLGGRRALIAAGAAFLGIAAILAGVVACCMRGESRATAQEGSLRKGDEERSPRVRAALAKIDQQLERLKEEQWFCLSSGGSAKVVYTLKQRGALEPTSLRRKGSRESVIHFSKKTMISKFGFHEEGDRLVHADYTYYPSSKGKKAEDFARKVAALEQKSKNYKLKFKRL